jgi:hypothetical protein
MSKVSGFDMGRDEFSIPSSRMTGQDAAVQIPMNLSLNNKSVVVLSREINAASTSFNKKLEKIKDHIGSLQVDKSTDTVLMDKSFIEKLDKLFNQVQADFGKIVQIAQQLK